MPVRARVGCLRTVFDMKAVIKRYLLPLFALLLFSGCSGLEETNGDILGTSEDISTVSSSKTPEECPENTPECVAKYALSIWRDSGELEAIQTVESISSQSRESYLNCHDILHKLGYLVAQEPPTNGTFDFSESGVVACSGGFIHGLFAGYGTQTGWAEKFVQICGSFKETESILCRHGYGHGAVAGAFDVNDAMRRCEEINKLDPIQQIEDVSLLELCSDGAFMEVVYLVKTSKWNKIDPVYTCTNLSKWRAWGCWRQTGRLLEPGNEAVFINTCNELDAYLGEACAIGAAESAVENGVGADRICHLLYKYEELCTERFMAIQR